MDITTSANEIRAEHLTRRFGDVTAVDDVSLTIPGGRMTGFVGGNGAGKTTTMRMIMGVLQPTEGQVLWQGRPITVDDRRTFGYMPEERGLYPKQKVGEQLVHLARLAGLSAADARASVEEHLERLGLAHRAGDPVEKLSLGNQQRVQIIAAVMTRPAALVLDEPFSGLDPDAVDSMADLLREHVARGIPVLFSSHQLDLVERLCDRLIILSGGRKRAEGTVTELRSAGAQRHRVTLRGDAGWLRDLPGLDVVDVDGREAVLELLGDETQRRATLDRLLTEATARGGLDAIAPIVPRLSDIYREVTA